jgi:DNA processing protein
MHENSQNLLLACLAATINLNLPRLELILANYTTLKDATSDNFELLKNQNPTWLVKYWEQKPELNPEKLAQKLTSLEIGLVSILDDNYPAKLKFLPNPPILLYFQGDLDLVNSSSLITVVGSRNLATYSKQIMNKILTPVIAKDVVVVSGLALGVDTLAHSLAVENQAKTIAVIGSGLDEEVFYPSQNLKLKKQILDFGGLILSEYPLNFRPTIYSFPARNRILAALSNLTWVVQASQKSGSLITAKVAFEIGKTVATTPASILDTNFEGNLKLIQEGASIISKSEDIEDILGLVQTQTSRVEKSVEFINLEEKIVYTNLSFSPQNLEKIVEISQLEFAQVQTTLTMLELRELVLNLGENNWVKR